MILIIVLGKVIGIYLIKQSFRLLFIIDKINLGKIVLEVFMYIRKKLIMKIILVFVISLIVFGGGYVLSYLRYNDTNIVINAVLEKQNNILKEEIKELRKLNNIKGELVIGRVISRDLYSFLDEVIIDVGSNEKINKGDAVLNSVGLVGIVDKVLDKTAYVKLLSGDYNVSVEVNQLYGNLNQGMITLLNKYAEIEKDTLVYTSGYGNIPKGIYVGKVKDVAIDKDNLGKEVRVELIDNRYLNYVVVMRNE